MAGRRGRGRACFSDGEVRGGRGGEMGAWRWEARGGRPEAGGLRRPKEEEEEERGGEGGGGG
jgi:hypothetical protein